MNNPRLQQLTQLITSRRPSFWLWLVFGMGFVVLVAYLVANYAVLYVTAKTPQDVRPVIYANTATTSSRAGSPGLIIVPRATSSLTIAASDYQKTITSVQIPWYGYRQIHTRVEVDKNADKIAYNATSTDPCATYDPDRDTLLSFDCTRPDNLSLYQTPSDKSWTNLTVGRIEKPNDSVRSYLGGVIGISYIHNTSGAPPAPLFAVDPSGKRRYLDAPEGLDLSNFTLGTITTDPNDPRNQRFIYVAWDGTIYLGTPKNEGTKVDYIKYNSPAGYNPTYERTLCSLLADRAACYQGRSRTAPYPVPINGSGEYRREGTIVKLSFSDESIQTIKTESDVNIGEFFMTSTGQTYGQQDKKLYKFDTVNGRSVRSLIATNVNRAITGDSLYFTQEEGVYEYDTATNTAYQRFYARNITPRNLFISDGQIFVLGSIKNAGSTMYAYLLTDSDNTTPGTRLIDKLPAAFVDLPGVSRQDLVFNKLMLILKVNINREARNRAEAVNQQQVDNLRNDTLERLRDKGVDIDTLEINVRY